jgi:hypothetical protein
LLKGEGEGMDGVGAKSYDGEKTWYSVIHKYSLGTANMDHRKGLLVHEQYAYRQLTIYVKK